MAKSKSELADDLAVELADNLNKNLRILVSKQLIFWTVIQMHLVK